MPTVRSKWGAVHISLALGKNGLAKTVEQILDPTKYPVITPEAINEIAHAVTEVPFEKRDNDGKITGEWVVFARHRSKNYYLGLANHDSEDQLIYNNVVESSIRDFPDLKNWLPA